MSRETDTHMPEDDNSLAAEYVLGVQTAELRETLAKRLQSDAAFAALVATWEVHLAPMNDEYEDAVPPAHIKTALFERLFPDIKKQRSGLWNSLALWRGLTAGAVALCLFTIGTTLLKPEAVTPGTPIIASLQADTGDVRFMAFYETGTNEIRLSKVSSQKPANRDYELWLIEADGTPQSLGVIADTDSARVVLSADYIAKINSGDTFAISIEPIGGSPTGAVTGPVIAAGVSSSL